MSKKIEQSVFELVAPVAEKLGYEVIDVEFVKMRGQDSELVIYIDKPGGIDLDDCEACSIAIDPVIDAADPIDEAYVLCVSSPGIDRPLKKPRDFERHMGGEVDVKLYEKLNGKKEFTAELTGYTGETILLLVKGETLELPANKVALIRPHIDF